MKTTKITNNEDLKVLVSKIDANKVLIIQTYSPKPEVSVIAVVQKSKKP